MTVRDSDYIQQLANYIKRNFSKGYDAETLRWSLVKQGRNRTQIEKAIILAQHQMAMTAPKFEERPIIKVEPAMQRKKEGFFSKFVNWFKS